MAKALPGRYLRNIERLAYLIALWSFLVLFFETIISYYAPYQQVEIYTAIANLLFLAFSTMARIWGGDALRDYRHVMFDLVLFIPGVILLFFQPKILIFLLLIRQTYFFLQYLLFRAMEGKLFKLLSDNPPVSLMLSFALVIVVGTVLLMLPSANVAHRVTAPIDALFIATSATCVTGLAVFDIGSTLTLMGQLVVLLLIQIGGLGIMTISTAFALIMGQRLTLKLENIMYSVMGKDRRLDIFQLLKSVILVTAIIELVGAALLFFVFSREMDPAQAIYHSVFHSVSAFCNAGFSLFPDSLIRYVEHPLLNVVITILITLGGVGFAVIIDLYHRFFSRDNHKLSLHSKLVLVTTLALLLIGAVGFFWAEYNNTMRGFDLDKRLFSSWFQSTSSRTAGFDTIACERISPATVLICQALMFVGASPGSTGGGMKTTTLALLVISVISIFRGRRELTVFNRKIPMSNLREAVALISLITFILLLSTFLLLITEHKAFDKVAFEAISAFSTCGLSMGITPYLTHLGKFIIILLMYIGRIGPLTMIYALSMRKVQPRLSYAEEKVMIG